MRSLLLLILGIILGVCLDRYVILPKWDSGHSLHPYPSERTIDEKRRQWHLTSDDIRQDLARTGEVVREQAHVVGDKISDARIVTVVKAKYVLDSSLSANDIHVSATNGHVTLTGTAASPELIGKAVALAMDTDGVTGVSSRLVVAAH